MEKIEEKNENNKKVKTLGEKIVEGRRKKGLSQEKFAEKMGCTRQMVSRWELDLSVPRTQKIRKISNILNISIEDLVGGNEPSPKNQDVIPVAKNFDYKSLIKYILITITTIFAIYLLYCGYKMLVLNTITSKVAQYQNVDNYHFKVENYIDKERVLTKEILYKDGLCKEIETNIINNTEYSSTTYFDINNGYRYLVDDENKTYSEIKMVNTEQYEDGKYMYSLFPLTINTEYTDINAISFKLNKVFAYIKDKKIYLNFNNETLEFDKDSLLPISQYVIMKENQIVQENFNKFSIELNTIEDNDVKISEDYRKVD